MNFVIKLSPRHAEVLTWKLKIYAWEEKLTKTTITITIIIIQLHVILVKQ